MNIATLATMRMVDILNLTKKEITKIGREKVIAALTKKCKRSIWLVYSYDDYGSRVIVGSAASKAAAEYMVTQLNKLSNTDKYWGGTYDYYVKEIPYGGFNTEAFETCNDYGFSIKTW